MNSRVHENTAAVVEFIEQTLFLYGKSLESVSFLVADNTELNPAVARCLNVPFVGCMSHRLALAVQSYLRNTSLINLEQLHSLMVQLINEFIKGKAL